jgi:Tfp pilus assembly protein PilP
VKNRLRDKQTIRIGKQKTGASAINFAMFAILMLSVLLLYPCQAGYTADSKIEQKKAEAQKKETVVQKPAAPVKFNIGDFVYTSENRRDPFNPVSLLRLKETNTGKNAKKGYELEELKFVGLLRADKNRYVMMEDAQGRGITFKKGDYLNNNLWIRDVLDGKVVFAYKLKEEIKKFTVDIPKK